MLSITSDIAIRKKIGAFSEFRDAVFVMYIYIYVPPLSALRSTFDTAHSGRCRASASSRPLVRSISPPTKRIQNAAPHIAPSSERMKIGSG